MWSSNSTSMCITKSTESRNSHRKAETHITQKSQTVKTTQMSNNRWTDKQNMVNTYNGGLFSLKKGRNYDAAYNTDEF